MADTQNITLRRSPLLQSDSDFIVDYRNVSLRERKALTAIQVLSFKGHYENVAASIGKALGIDCPITAGSCHSDDHTQIAWIAPNSWMIICSDTESGRAPGELLETLQNAVADSAAVVDQSHGRCGLRLSGSKAGKVMAKNTAIDLHPSAFAAGDCAQTSVAHMNATVIQVDDVPTYDLFVARSLARSFTHTIEHACQEFEDE